ELFGPAAHEGRVGDTGRDRLPAHHDLLDRITVEHQFHGFANQRVVEGVGVGDVGRLQRLFAEAITEVDEAVFRADFDLEAFRVAQALDVLRRHVLNDINLAREQRRDTGLRVGNGEVFDIGDGRLLAPPTVVVGQH